MPFHSRYLISPLPEELTKCRLPGPMDEQRGVGTEHRDRRKMTAGPIKLQSADVRSVHRFVAALEQFFFDKGLQQPADGGPARHPQNQPAARRLADREEPKLFT